MEILNNIKDGIILVIMFGMAIFIHELGHFLVALRCGLVVETFSIGFGKGIVEWKKNGITYKIGWIPLGGYVALPQLDPTGMAMVQGSGDNADGKKEEAKPLPYVSPWAKMLVAVAGAGGNMVLALVIAIIIANSPSVKIPNRGPLIIAVETDSPAYAAGLRTGQELLKVNGTPVKGWNNYMEETLLPGSDKAIVSVRSKGTVIDIPITMTPHELMGRHLEGLHEGTGLQVTEVVADSPASAAGVKPGDVLLSFDGVPIQNFPQLNALIAGYDNKTATLMVSRDGADVALTATPRMNAEHKAVQLGIWRSSGPNMPWMQEKGVWAQLASDAKSVTRILKALTSKSEFKQAAANLGGVATIGYTFWESIQMGRYEAIAFLRFLCVNLAILNLLPIPLLDGGHVMFCLWEGITRRRVHPRVANALVNTFGALLIAALLYINIRDVVRLPRMLKLVHGQDTVQAATSTNAPAKP